MSAIASNVTVRFCLSDVEVSSSDVGTVKEFLSKADPAVLVDHILVGQAGWGCEIADIDGAAKSMLIDRVCSILELMSEMEADVDVDPGSILVPWQWFDTSDRFGGFRRFVGAALIRFDRLSLADRAIARMGGYAETVSAMREASSLIGGIAPCSELSDIGAATDIADISGESWPKVLGRSLWLPRALSVTERAMALSHIFWNMTYMGFGVDWKGAYARPQGHALGDHVKEDIEFQCKMEAFVDLLNYNSWLSCIDAAKELGSLRT